MLLTDGDPNIFPPSGFIPQLKKYKNAHKNFRPVINTYAIGKYIDSVLLDNFANEGNGQYCFIPCPGFIGTVFVNSISNILSTFASNCELKIEPLNGAKIEKIYGGLPMKDNSTILVGNLQYGQSREIVLKISRPDFIEQQ